MVDAAAPIVDAIVRGCPLVAVLATSREPLGVTGEHLRPLAPLPIPGVGLTDVAAANGAYAHTGAGNGNGNGGLNGNGNGNGSLPAAEVAAPR